jgi:predicted transport protein
LWGLTGVNILGDIKLYKLNDGDVTELEGKSVAVEKSLQTLMERHLEAILGIRFLATEYSTGKTHGGRIDTLGIDENNAPVIIEYKRSINENVISQGLYYLDWLLDHKAEFTLLVMKKYGSDIAELIDWSIPRLLCIAGGFTKYDEHAVQQINRNIELYSYKRFGDELLLLDLVNATTAKNIESDAVKQASSSNKSTEKTVSEYLNQSDTVLKNRFEAIRAFLLALGDDVQENTLKHYFAFRRIKNFACIEIHPQMGRITVYVKVNPDSKTIEPGFTRDVRKIGHFGTGELEITIMNDEQFPRRRGCKVRQSKKNRSNLDSPSNIAQKCDLSDLNSWLREESKQIGNIKIRDIVLGICLSIDDFVCWPLKADLLWEECDRVPIKGSKVKYHKYPENIRQRANFMLDGRPNGPAVAAYLIARPPRFGSNNSWSVHHIYSGKFPYIGRNSTLHASHNGKHFTQSAGLVAIHPIADQLADEFPFFSWYLRALSFEKFKYDPDGVFSDNQIDDYGFIMSSQIN